MKKTKSLWLTGLLLVFLLAACIGTPKPAPEPLKLAWSYWQGDYTMVIAQKMGLFEKRGVNVELTRYDNSQASIPDLAGAKVDGGIYSMSDLLLASNLADIRGVMVTDDGSAYSIVADSDIKSLADLKGARIGLNLHTASETLVTLILQDAGLTRADVTFIEMSPQDVINGIPRNRVDAGLVWEPYTDMALAKGEKVLFQNASYSALVPRLITFRKDVLDQRPDDIRNFLLAWDDAIYFRIHHPSESLAVLAVATGLTGEQLTLPSDFFLYNAAKNHELFQDISGTQITSIYYVARFDRDSFIKLGYITNPPDVTKLLDPSFLK